MKRISILFVVVAVAIAVAVPPVAGAAGGWTRVTGYDDATCGDTPAADGHTCDVERLQAAVDRGGKILLRGTFNLGAPAPETAQTVFITKDVDLRGRNATIYGGYNTLTIGIAGHEWAFEAFSDWAFVYETRIPVAVSVRGIRFENYFSVAIYDLASTDLDIRRNEFVDGMPTGFQWPGDPVATPSGYAVLVTTAAQFLGAATDYEDISGTIRVIGNVVDGRARSEGGGFPFMGGEWKGLVRGFRFGHMAADVTVKGNTMEDYHELPIVLDGIKGRTILSGNWMSDAADTYDRRVHAIQIMEEGWGPMFGFPGVDPAEATTVIRDNEIVSNHLVQAVFAVNFSDEVTIKDNEIRVLAGVEYDVFSLWGTTDSIIRDNQISGEGGDILWLAASSGNLFKDNDTEDFISSFVDYYADADSNGNTTYLQEDETYLDEGTGNRWISDD
jgi:hypothetical protein